MTEARVPNSESPKEIRRQKIARQYYEYYAMLSEVEKDISRIMSGGSASDTPQQQHDCRRIRHALKSWGHALTIPVEGGLVSQFMSPAAFIALEHDSDPLARYVISGDYTWAQKITEMKKYCEKIIRLLYRMPFDEWKSVYAPDIHGKDLIKAFLAKVHRGEE